MEPEAPLSSYDLTLKLLPYIDRHLAFPVLAHLAELSLFPEEDVKVAQYELAKETNMVDFTVGLFTQLWQGKDLPEGESISVAIEGPSDINA